MTIRFFGLSQSNSQPKNYLTSLTTGNLQKDPTPNNSNHKQALLTYPKHNHNQIHVTPKAITVAQRDERRNKGL